MAISFAVQLDDPSALLSPSLVIDRALVIENLDAMIKVARSADRLRPHIKTHKMPVLVKLCESKGVTRHKVATIAEAEMAARAGATDVMLAYPLVGPNIGRLARLLQSFPATTFRTVVDDSGATRALSSGLNGVDRRVPVLVDLDVGMGRTGIDVAAAEALYELVASLPNLQPDGLSAYDGHIHDFEPSDRATTARPGIEATLALRKRLQAKNLPVPRLVLGGTPTFPIHAAVEEPGVECSPGTCIFHDVNYATKYPDLPFRPAAALLTRVISRPRPGRLCLDLGHKAVAADPPVPRVAIPALPDIKFVVHSEEHLVVDTSVADQYPPGSALLAYPSHICPTCALHRRAYVVENGKLVDEWEVGARDRVLTY